MALTRSKEITERLQRDTNKNIDSKTFCILIHDSSSVGLLSPHRSHQVPPNLAIQAGPETPTKRSTTARWMIKYVLRRCSRRCFTNTIMVMILRTVMTKDSTLITTSQGIHCDAGARIHTSSLALFWVPSLMNEAIALPKILLSTCSAFIKSPERERKKQLNTNEKKWRFAFVTNYWQGYTWSESYHDVMVGMSVASTLRLWKTIV